MKIDVQHILIFALIILVGFDRVVLAFVPIPDGNRDMFIQTGAAIIGVFTLVAGYYWGKSRSLPDQVDKVDVQADKVEVKK